MKLDDLGYAKSEGKRIPMSANVKELQDEQPYTATHIDADVIAESDYVKGSPTIEATVIFIISGGSRRERDYFHPIFIETGLIYIPLKCTKISFSQFLPAFFVFVFS